MSFFSSLTIECRKAILLDSHKEFHGQVGHWQTLDSIDINGQVIVR